MAKTKRQLEWDKPHTWPTKWRRLFLLTLPISVPLWCAAMVAYLIGLIILLICLTPIIWIWSMWTGEKMNLDW